MTPSPRKGERVSMEYLMIANICTAALFHRMACTDTDFHCGVSLAMLKAAAERLLPLAKSSEAAELREQIDGVEWS